MIVLIDRNPIHTSENDRGEGVIMLNGDMQESERK
jgi:hypothetical protein